MNGRAFTVLEGTQPLSREEPISLTNEMDRQGRRSAESRYTSGTEGYKNRSGHDTDSRR